MATIKVYRILKGSKTLGMRKGQYAIIWRGNDPLAPSDEGPYHMAIGVGRAIRTIPPYWQGNGDIALDWGATRRGWDAYEYTHGGKVYRHRCAMVSEYPDIDTVFWGFRWEEAPDDEAQRVLRAWEKMVTSAPPTRR